MRTIQSLGLLILCVACGDQQDTAAPADSSTTTTLTPAGTHTVPMLGADTAAGVHSFRCDDGSAWSVSTWRGPGARITLVSTDTSFTLPQRIAASGVRYADSTERIVWWNKGDSATFERAGRTLRCAVATDVEF